MPPHLCWRAVDVLQVREFVSLLGLMTSCVAGRALLRAVACDPTCNVSLLLKPVVPSPSQGTDASVGQATPSFATPSPSPAAPQRSDDNSADAVTSLLPICAIPSQDFVTRQLVLCLGVSECPSSEGFLRHVVFSPESSQSLKYVSNRGHCASRVYCAARLRG